ncbi:MAG TPA: tetratricopeptide repeat protein, partial [Giesbergeria sp.]|nr:tetratricopeptide repeat protein [Giesbergeria sp.]
WPPAEADFRKALELYPDQPLVLNYLGYSWVDRHMNLEEGFKMLRRAVELRPTDGYIVDSLGWAHYRLGRYDEAVKELERAIALSHEKYCSASIMLGKTAEIVTSFDLIEA